MRAGVVTKDALPIWDTEPYGENILTLKVKGQESKQVRGK